MPEVVTFGETSAVLETTSVGKMRYARSFRLRPGGAEATVAVGVSRLGHSSGWISRLGADEFGEYILRVIRAEGVDVSEVELVDGERTAVFFRERLPDGKARQFYYRNDSAFSHITAEDLNEDYIRNASILHITGITPAVSLSTLVSTRRAIQLAQKHNVLVSFDTNMRRKIWNAREALPVMEEFVAAADIVLPGLDDLRGFLSEDVTISAAMEWLQGLGCNRAVIKLGKDGAVVLQDQKVIEVPPVALTEPIDVVGAGDAFASGFLVGVLRDYTLKEAALLGNRVAAASITLPGNIESLPDWKELEEFEKSSRDIQR